MKTIVAVACGVRQSGGSFQYASGILEILSQLPKDAYDVRFVYTSTEWQEVAASFGIRAYFLPTGGIFFRIVRKLLKIWLAIFPKSTLERFSTLDRVKYEIYRAKPDICICLEQNYIPVHEETTLIAPIHDIMHRYESRFPEVGTVQEYVAREFLAQHLVREASVLVDSNVGKAQLIECYSCAPEHIHVLPFTASVLLSGVARKPRELAIGPDVPFVFYPAQFWLHKNHCALVKALALLPQELKLHAVFVGSTNKEGFKATEACIAAHGLADRVHVLGYVTDAEVQWLYQHAACMVMPSFFGPTNIPPLEAMRAGCPVAVAKVYGNMEQLGDAALFFDPHSPEEVAACITSIMTDSALRTSLVNAGYFLSEKWNAAAFKARFKSILEDIIRI